ncbi:MAG: CpcT/CpeT family chromophore lyase [Synechococcus sp.]
MSDRPSHNLLELTRCLAGHFNNFDQAIDKPVYYANIHVQHCPLPWSVFNGPGLYLEQYYDIYPEHPYRQGAYRIYETEEGLWMQNYLLKNPSRYIAAYNDPAQVEKMLSDDFMELSGCLSRVTPKEVGFSGASVPTKDCQVERDGRLTYLSVEFTITREFFHSWDRGLDVNTDEQVWGAILGSFEFKKVEDYSDRVLPSVNLPSNP